jgi:hypothetical protein
MVLFFLMLIGTVALFVALTDDRGIEIFTMGHAFWVGLFTAFSWSLNSFFKARNEAKKNYYRHYEAVAKQMDKAPPPVEPEEVTVKFKKTKSEK